MKRISYFPLIFLMIFLFVVLSLPKTSTQALRKMAIASIVPLWQGAHEAGSTLFVGANFSKTKDDKQEEVVAQLTLQNQLLNSQIESVYEWLSFEQRVDEQMQRLKNLSQEKQSDLYWNEFFHRRVDELRQILEIELQSLPAKVIFREPEAWSSSLWINIGEKENEELGRQIVAKNSPVVVGESLVGLVEYVGKTQSRVRLITDSGLVPSVRALRGSSQNRVVSRAAHTLLEVIYSRQELFSSVQEKELFLSQLKGLIEKLSEKKEDWYLAKGEVLGSSEPLWRSRGKILKGMGFNYEYADKEGPKRDLQTGEVEQNFLPKTPILQEGDLLVTTGMDGVFPAGLHVAIVSKVAPLEEGAYCYSIEAKATADRLEDLEVVFVMPPVAFDRKAESFQ